MEMCQGGSACDTVIPMKKMNSFLGLLSLLFLGLLSVDSVRADLGSAELPLRPQND